MFDDLTWDAILQAWPWFGAAAAVFVFAVGLFIALRPKPKRKAEKAAKGADKKDWTLTGKLTLPILSQSERLYSKWRRLGFPLAQVASNTAKFVGEGRRYLKQKWL